MELCKMTLRDAINYINKEMNQNYDNGVTIIGAYLASQIFKEILEGVNYLHTQSPPIIHRDLKLSNILIANGEDGYFVKIGDFGLATIHSNDNSNNREFDDQNIVETEDFDINNYHTQKLGTYRYMAEEVKSGKYDTSADMYSLGVILCKLFCVKIDDVHTFEIVNQHKQFTHYPIKQIKLIRKLLQEWASKRPNCDKILGEKHEWSVSFDDIKFTNSLREICFNSWESRFKNDESKVKSDILTAMLIKKCEVEVKKNLYNLRTNVSTENFKDYFAMRNAINVRLIEKESNIIDQNLCDKIFKCTLHAFNVCIDLPDLCLFIEKTLNEGNISYWHCFATSENNHTFEETVINWFNTPYYIISFNNEFRINVIHIIIINIQNTIAEEKTEFTQIKNTMEEEMSKASKLLSYKAIGEYININEMQLYISDGLKQKYNDYNWHCYITKYEFITCHEIFPIPKYYFAFRLKEYCILIVNEELENINYNAIRYEDKILRNISIDDKYAIEAAFTPQIINCCLILKEIKFSDDKRCILRICDSIQYTKENYHNYKMYFYDVQILWINNHQFMKQIPILCGNTVRKAIIKNEMTKNEINIEIENLSKDIANISSGNNALLGWLTRFQKVLLNTTFDNSIKSKISSLGVIDIVHEYLNRSESLELQIVLLHTTNYYIRRMIESDHKPITSKLIPTYVKLLESNNDNICFHVLEAFYLMIYDCDECYNKSLENGLLMPLLQLLKPNKSLALIAIIAKLITIIAIPKNFLPPIDIVKQLIPAVNKLIDQTDNNIILNMISIMRNLSNTCYNYSEYKDIIFDSGINEKFVQLLVHDNKRVQQEAIFVLANTFKQFESSKQLSGDALDLNVYLQLSDMLKSDRFDLRISSIFVLRIISYKNEANVQYIIDAQLIPLLADILKSDIYDIQKHAITIIFNIISESTEEQCLNILSYIYSNGVINSLCNFISSSHDEYICIIILCILQKLLINCKEHRTQIFDEIVACGGLEKIQKLRHHENEDLRDNIDNFLTSIGLGTSELEKKSEN